jgi:exopolysaccharide biosynthesis protein
MIPRSRWQRIALIAGFAVLFLIALAAAAHDAIERTLLEHALARAFGGDVSIGQLRHTGDRVIVDGLHAQTAAGSVVVTANRYSYTVNGDSWDVTPDALHVTVSVDTFGGDQFAGAENAAHVLNLRRLVLHVKNASVSLVRGTGAAKVELAGIDGVLALFDRPAYALTGNVIAETGAYPFAAGSAHWTAAAVPLAGFTALLGDPDLRVQSGEAHAVSFTTAGGVRGAFTLADVRATLAGHPLHDLAGPVAVVPDGIGSRGLDAVLDDGTPVAAVGEVHDGLNWNHMLASGSRDLRAVVRMFALIARQPNHRWMNVDTTAPGITFGQYAMTIKTTPHVVQMIEVDPHEPTVRFDTALAADHIISKGERTSDLGIRTHAVAGANGDYFDIGRTYEPQGLLIERGRLLHGPTDHEAVVIDRNNNATFAIFHLHGSVIDGARRYPVTLYNSWPTRDVAIITPDYGALLPAAPGVTFLALEPLANGTYRVTSRHPMTSALPVTFGIGMSDAFAPLPAIGDVVTLRYALDPPVPGAVAGIGSGPLILKDGAWYEDKRAPAPDERDVQWPVISIGTMPAGTYMFVAVDGRHPERSIGMTRPEFGELLKGFGTIDAMALDSGGSVTLVSRQPGNTAVTVRNVPSDFDAERYVSDALFVYSSAPLGTIVTAPLPHVEPTPGVATLPVPALALPSAVPVR